MSSKKSRSKKGRRNGRPRARVQRRCVQWRDGVRTEVTSRKKGYDVKMIRDFLDHLLLELRVQHYENREVLKRLDSTKSGPREAADLPPAPRLIDQLAKYVGKYWSCLIHATAIDETGVDQEQATELVRQILEAKSQTRDEQIGHLEALQDLFSEALFCARLPFGKTCDGDFVQPTVVEKLSDLLEESAEYQP